MMLLSFGEIIFGALSLRDSEKQQMEYGKSLADSYMDRIHKELDNIDYALITMVVDGDEIEELNNIIPDDVSVENMLLEPTPGRNGMNFLCRQENSRNGFYRLERKLESR